MSTYIRSRLAPAAVTAAALSAPLALHAQQAAAPTDGQGAPLPAVTVKAAADAASPVKTDRLDSPKFTQPLVDTPQTITVVNKETLQQQGAATLMDALRNIPGITMQLGEGGRTNVGDAFFLRGFAAESNVFQDGVRDLGPVVRDVFNLEQVEIVKGPAGADNGRGATGGYVNLVSKKPQAEDFVAGSVSVGSASAARATADLNRTLGEGVALRVNAMASDADVPGRDEVHLQSQGLATALTLGLGTPTRFTVQTQHVRQRNTPDGGVTTIGLDGYYDSDFDTGAAAGVTPAPADPSNFYGSTADHEDSDADMLTVRIEHDFGKSAKLVNTARLGRATVDRVLTSVNGVIAASTDPSTWTVERRRHSNLQSNTILANQTALQAELKTGRLRHSLAGGVEFSHERQNVTTLAVPGATSNTIPASPVYAPDPTASAGDAPVANGAYQHGRVTTAAAYLFDTIKLNPQWQLLAGLRHEHYGAETDRVDLVSNVLTPHALSQRGDITSWKLGVVYKPAANGSIYLAYADATTPPGGNTLTLTTDSVSASSADRAGLKPQRSQNLELGTKWELLNGQLALTATAYQSSNRNETIEVSDGIYSQDGERRVRGLELGIVGQITPAWQLSGGLATMDSEVVEGSFEGTNAAGAPSRWTPKLAVTAWTSYRVNDRLTVGGGARYLGKQQRVTDPAADLSTQNMPAIPAYWVADAMASYAVHKNVTLQLNVQNLFDKAYIATLNNNGNRYQPGAPRTFTLMANLLF
ncbi:catecholate siderophore receptor Fiu [Ideonella sp.]|uniref:catecholate siderophore receptor Fiu n=1 Tax=Ideonella sp. TaxID=1929293 RepID=UPI002B47AEFA|nr:catecholate siderophore receptor Fiu [Ideonella sp.]HJV68407.1 catecholate siderophore receptor Fiu [Ideonella sp.]